EIGRNCKRTKRMRLSIGKHSRPCVERLAQIHAFRGRPGFCMNSLNATKPSLPASYRLDVPAPAIQLTGVEYQFGRVSIFLAKSPRPRAYWLAALPVTPGAWP